MTKKEKLRILKGMKKLLVERSKDKIRPAYLCGCLKDFLGLLELPDEEQILELGIIKPKTTDFDWGQQGWWPNDYDYTSRLRALNKAIKKLQPIKK